MDPFSGILTLRAVEEDTCQSPSCCRQLLVPQLCYNSQARCMLMGYLVLHLLHWSLLPRICVSEDALILLAAIRSTCHLRSMMLPAASARVGLSRCLEPLACCTQDSRHVQKASPTLRQIPKLASSKKASDLQSKAPRVPFMPLESFGATWCRPREHPLRPDFPGVLSRLRNYKTMPSMVTS